MSKTKVRRKNLQAHNLHLTPDDRWWSLIDNQWMIVNSYYSRYSFDIKMIIEINLVISFAGISQFYKQVNVLLIKKKKKKKVTVVWIKDRLSILK